MQLAVPTPDQYLPLLYILGLQHDPAKHQLFNDELLAGSLSMTFAQGLLIGDACLFVIPVDKQE